MLGSPNQFYFHIGDDKIKLVAGVTQQLPEYFLV